MTKLHFSSGSRARKKEREWREKKKEERRQERREEWEVRWGKIHRLRVRPLASVKCQISGSQISDVIGLTDQRAWSVARTTATAGGSHKGHASVDTFLIVQVLPDDRIVRAHRDNQTKCGERHSAPETSASRQRHRCLQITHSTNASQLQDWGGESVVQ